jgi:hypothetical protein
VGLQRFGVFSVIEGTHTHTQKKKKKGAAWHEIRVTQKKRSKNGTKPKIKISLCLKFIFFQLLL